MSQGSSAEHFSDAEVLLRRFDPSRPPSSAHVVVDEGATPHRYVLSSGALKFDDDGCSTSRELVLTELGLTHMHLIEGPLTGIARTTKGRIDGYVHSSGGTDRVPFETIATPIVRGPGEESNPTDPAHASITKVECGLSKTQSKIAVRQLAKMAFELIHGMN